MGQTVLLALTATLCLVLVALCVAILIRQSRLRSDSVKPQLDRLEQRLGEEFARSRSENAGEQRSQRSELGASFDKMEQHLTVMSKSSHEQNLKTSQLLSEGLDAIRRSSIEQGDRQTLLVRQAVERMQQSNEQRLEQMRLTVDEKLSSTLTTRLDSSFKTVSQQLESVYKSLGEMKTLSTGVTDNVTALNRILTNVKARGTWAEVQLDSLLSETIPGMYERNAMTNPSSREIVEFAIKIPNSGNEHVLLPVDSKFPVEDYIRLCDSADRGDRDGVELAKKALSRRVLGFAKDISKYINEPVTTPFAIMYLATEGLYGEIINSPDGVAERIHREFGVMVAGPSTVSALLSSLAMGFRAMAINEKTKEIRILLAAAKTQYDKFGELLQKARKKIDEAGRSLDDAQNRNTLIQKKLRSVEGIEESSSSSLLGIEETQTEDPAFISAQN